jgi:hypothetical protein
VFGEGACSHSRPGFEPLLAPRNIHGKSKRRTWRKLHLLIDAETPVLLGKAPNQVGKFYGDGA